MVRADGATHLFSARHLPAKRLPQARVVIRQQTRRHHVDGPPPAVVLHSPVLAGEKKNKTKKERERGLGVTKEFKVEVEGHQGLALSPLLVCYGDR